jgi:hypothetical protein
MAREPTRLATDQEVRDFITSGRGMLIAVRLGPGIRGSIPISDPREFALPRFMMNPATTYPDGGLPYQLSNYRRQSRYAVIPEWAPAVLASNFYVARISAHGIFRAVMIRPARAVLVERIRNGDYVPSAAKKGRWRGRYGVAEEPPTGSAGSVGRPDSGTSVVASLLATGADTYSHTYRTILYKDHENFWVHRAGDPHRGSETALPGGRP